MKLNFRKMHGLGNDFVVIDAREDEAHLSGEQIRFLGDRRRGIGFDQLVILRLSACADIFMRIYNPDGSEAGACGNATRCIADMYFRETGRAECVIETTAGLLHCWRTGMDHVTVDMGLPGLEWRQIPLSEQCDTLALPLAGDPVGVSIGNPHCVYFCEDAMDVFVEKSGPQIEHNRLFPERTNVEFVSLMGPNHLRMRVWERGAGITQACGTGACAAAVAAIRKGLTGRKVKVTLDGGDLFIEWREVDGHVLMTGPACPVFSGQIFCPLERHA